MGENFKIDPPCLHGKMHVKCFLFEKKTLAWDIPSILIRYYFYRKYPRYASNWRDIENVCFITNFHWINGNKNRILEDSTKKYEGRSDFFFIWTKTITILWTLPILRYTIRMMQPDTNLRGIINFRIWIFLLKILFRYVRASKYVHSLHHTKVIE